MKKCTLFFFFAISLFSCYKWQTGYRDTKFRNSFIGQWRIDSIFHHLPIIVNPTTFKDTEYITYPLPGDYLDILFTKNQIEKNITCSGKFLDSVFHYEVQGFNDKGAQRLSFTYCNTCVYSEVFGDYIVGVKYVVDKKSDKLILESRFNSNGKDYFSKLYLTKK